MISASTIDPGDFLPLHFLLDLAHLVPFFSSISSSQSSYSRSGVILLSAPFAKNTCKKLPGYGVSSPSKDSSPLAIGSALLETSHTIFPKRAIILGGHDRGARICHRLAVAHANPPHEAEWIHNYTLLGAVILDIVPTLVQWQSFANPAASTAYAHWAFLPTFFAPGMIEAYGGDKWCHDQLSRIAGPNPSAVETAQSDDAWKVYESLNAKTETIKGSCADYAAAADPEPQQQAADQKAGRKIEVPTVVMWSLGRLGKMHGDVEAIWKQWVDDGVGLTAQGIGNDIGHYLPEEASETVGHAIIRLIDRVSD